MFINKIIGFTFIVNLVLLGICLAGKGDDINISQYKGVWFVMAFIRPEVNKSDVLECYWSDVTILNTTSQRFKQDTRLMMNGDLGRFTGYGKIYDHEIRLLTAQGGTWIGTVTNRVNGTELIIHDEIYPKYYQLFCRTPSVSAQTMTEFENIAAEIGATAARVNHSGCSYNSMD